MFLILSPGRTGTTSLVSALNTHSEINILTDKVAAPYLGRLWIQNVVSYEFLRDNLKSMLRLIYGKYTKRLKDEGKYQDITPNRGDWSTYTWTLIEPMEEIWKDRVDELNIKHVRVIRDLREIVSSYVARGLYLSNSAIGFRADADSPYLYMTRSIHEIKAEDLPVYSLDMEGWRCCACSVTKWQNMSQFEKVCWYVGASMAHTDYSLQFVPDNRKYTIRMEDLIKDPDTELKKIVLFLGYTPEGDMKYPHLAKSVKKVIHWKDWPAPERQCFELFCKPIMDKFYEGWTW